MKSYLKLDITDINNRANGGGVGIVSTFLH